jgi:hypothetical protein
MEKKGKDRTTRRIMPLSLDDDLKNAGTRSYFECEVLNPKTRMDPLGEAKFIQACKKVFRNLLGFNSDINIP